MTDYSYEQKFALADGDLKNAGDSWVSSAGIFNVGNYILYDRLISANYDVKNLTYFSI